MQTNQRYGFRSNRQEAFAKERLKLADLGDSAVMIANNYELRKLEEKYFGISFTPMLNVVIGLLMT